MRKAAQNLPPLPVRAARMLARLRKLRGLSDAEKSVHALGLAANTVVYLEDGTLVNFVYEVTGLGSFSRERQHARRARIHGHDVPVLRLERIRQSKQAVGRDKDKLHILLIDEFLRCRREAQRQRRTSAHSRSARWQAEAAGMPS